jgi:predicted transcriptional regulator
VAEDQIERVADQYPAFAAQFAKLYHLYRTNAQRLEAIDEALGSDTLSGGRLPWEEVRDWFNAADNYVHLIDSRAEDIAIALAGQGASPDTAQLTAWFAGRGITLRMETTSVMRSYDEEKRELLLNANQPTETLRFQMAFQICAIVLEQEIHETVASSHLVMQTARRLLTLGLTNYAAGALLMPYRNFRNAARGLRHDIDQLRQIFSVSFEQACHRLSTLQRPHARGVPVFFCKIDMGGNITKRHAANGLQFARFAGSCPLWIAHEAVTVPERMHLQIAEMPEGGRYVFLARGQLKPSDSFFQPPRRHALVLGWEASLAGEFVYADTLNMACEGAVARIGISCRICSRLDCQQRAYPPNEKQISVDTSRRGAIPYEIS